MAFGIFSSRRRLGNYEDKRSHWRYWREHVPVKALHFRMSLHTRFCFQLMPESHQLTHLPWTNPLHIHIYIYIHIYTILSMADASIHVLGSMPMIRQAFLAGLLAESMHITSHGAFVVYDAHGEELVCVTEHFHTAH